MLDSTVVSHLYTHCAYIKHSDVAMATGDPSEIIAPHSGVGHAVLHSVTHSVLLQELLFYLIYCASYLDKALSCMFLVPNYWFYGKEGNYNKKTFIFIFR